MRPPTASPRPLRLLGVFAHPDDETFCAGGTLARYVAAGAEAMVVSATPGDAGQIRDSGVATRRTLGQVRAGELRLACQRLGVQHAVCWDYGDGTLHRLDPAVLTAHVARIIRAFRPDVVITFGEDGASGHPDHIAIGTATTAACRRAGDPAQFPEQLADGLAAHGPARLYHYRFPLSRLLFLERLVHWLVGHDRRFRGSYAFTRALLHFTEEATVLGYISDAVDVQWFPRGFSIVEQGEPATSLYLILSGEVEVLREAADGTLRRLARLGVGEFFGEAGLAHRRVRNAHVVAAESVTCLTFSSGQPTAFAGRGAGANPEHALAAPGGDGRADARGARRELGEATTCIDVAAYVERKVAAIAAHRTQCPLEPDMLPLAMLQEMLGREYFVRVLPPREPDSESVPSAGADRHRSGHAAYRSAPSGAAHAQESHQAISWSLTGH